MDLSLCWTTTPKGVLLVKLIEPPLAEPHERWCERSKIALKEEFSPTRFTVISESSRQIFYRDKKIVIFVIIF